MTDLPTLLLADPDISQDELDAVQAALTSPRLRAGSQVEHFEDEWAARLGRKQAVAVSSATLGLVLILKALELGTGDEIITSGFGFRETAAGIALAGCKPVLADVDYWSGTLAPEKARLCITENTRAILVGNTNGHPAAWPAFRELAQRHGLYLIEDSTEAIGSRYLGKTVGTFGDCALFDFSEPSPLTMGEGGMIVTNDAALATRIRALRSRRLDERHSVVLNDMFCYRAEISELSAALGRVQLRRLDEILARRKQVEAWYQDHVLSFEGIKPPYLAPDVDEAHWMLYLVHLGTRFTRSSRDAIVQDLATEAIEACAYSFPLHLQSCYTRLGYRKGDLFVTEKLADRAIALPFHGHLTEDQIGFIVTTAKDSSVNVGAGAAIYL